MTKIKLDVDKLSRMLIEQFPLIIKKNSIDIPRNQTQEFIEFIDKFRYRDVKDNEIFPNTEYEELMRDMMPFLIINLYTKLKNFVKDFDKEQNEILKNRYKYYTTVKEE